eukprot:382181_1
MTTTSSDIIESSYSSSARNVKYVTTTSISFHSNSTSASNQIISSISLLGRTNVLVDINGCPYVVLLLVLDLDTVGITLIPLLEYDSIGKVSNVTLYLITDLESELIGLNAGLETISQPVMI